VLSWCHISVSLSGKGMWEPKGSEARCPIGRGAEERSASFIPADDLVSHPNLISNTSHERVQRYFQPLNTSGTVPKPSLFYYTQCSILCILFTLTACYIDCRALADASYMAASGEISA